MRHRYLDILGSVSPTVDGVADIVAALAPPPRGSVALEATPAAPKASFAKSALKLAPGVAGAVAGAVVWKKHRVLGALVGHALGSAVYPLYNGERTKPLSQLGVEAAGVAGALLYKKHPAVGWAGGMLAGLVVSAFVPGSAVQEEYLKLRHAGK